MCAACIVLNAALVLVAGCGSAALADVLGIIAGAAPVACTIVSTVDGQAAGQACGADAGAVSTVASTLQNILNEIPAASVKAPTTGALASAPPVTWLVGSVQVTIRPDLAPRVQEAARLKRAAFSKGGA